MQLQAKPKGHQVHAYETYPSSSISRSKFDRSHSLMTSMNAGYITPVYHDLAFPGDTLQLNATTFSRLATCITPFMDNVYMDIHFFAVPIRLLWEHWKNLNGEKIKSTDSTDYLTPQLKTNATTSEVTTGSIFDYFGIPVGVKNLSFNAFNFRAYNLIYQDWYMDENLITDYPVIEDGDTDLIANYKLRKRGKRKDYFTSCLPSPQKGPAVDLPLGVSAPVVFNQNINTSTHVLTDSAYKGKPLALVNSGGYGNIEYATVTGSTATYTGTAADSVNTFVADLTNATAATINSLRQAEALMRLYETDSRGGTRYTEMILAHFGVKSPDARLQRPEFLGGGTFDLHLNAVPQMSASLTGSPQGKLSAYGTVLGSTRDIVHSFTEHCIVIGLASIRADMTYQQGLDRQYCYRNRTDFYLPTLCNLGEQSVLNKEIYAQGTSTDDLVFGYQERWGEMRSKFNRITGQLRSTATTPLDLWHLAQDFDSCPQLNSEFIEENPPIDRVIAVEESENTPQFICNFYFKEYWTRPMSVYSIPNNSAHF